MHHAGSVAASIVVLAACSTGAGTAPDGPPPTDAKSEVPGCGAAPARVYAHGEAIERVVRLDDVTGDGRADELAIVQRGAGYALVVADAPAMAIDLPADGYLLSVLAVDVDVDGRLDIVVGAPRSAEVAVFRGPLDRMRAWTSAEATFTAHTGGGLSNLFGTSFVVADVDADGVRDLVIAAPAEGEEGCLGQEPPRVFRGPLAGVRAREDAHFVLGGPERVCLGEHSSCVASGFQLEDRTGGCHQYALPVVDGAEPTACARR